MINSVYILGAGLSGLVASITLANEGYDVHVYDKENKLGGNKRWHPSIQTTVLNQKATWDYIGIDLSECFELTKSISFYRYGKKKKFVLDNMYVCERGPRNSSLDYKLFEMALKKGVNFHFDNMMTIDTFFYKENVILASGLNLDVYKNLKIPYIPIHGFRAVQKLKPTRELISYMLKCTNYDFAYMISKNDLVFVLLFSRKALDKGNLNEFRDVLKKTENIEFNKWQFSEGAMPVNKNLFYKNMILAGTISGMIDPFVLHGISGALTSGKVAAQTITDKEKGREEFEWLSKNFHRKKFLKQVSSILPFKSNTIPLMMWIDAHLRGVGFVK